jgi:hypothetical protein
MEKFLSTKEQKMTEQEEEELVVNAMKQKKTAERAKGLST